MIDDPGCKTTNMLWPGNADPWESHVALPNVWDFYGTPLVGLSPDPAGRVLPVFDLEDPTSAYAYVDPDTNGDDWLPNYTVFWPLMMRHQRRTTATEGNHVDEATGYNVTGMTFDLTPATFGVVDYNGHWALCVEWDHVAATTGGFQEDARLAEDPTPANTLQALFVDRSDLGAGAWDLIYNYGSVQWAVTESPEDSSQYGTTQGMNAGWIAANPNACPVWYHSEEIGLNWHFGYDTEGNPGYDIQCPGLPHGQLWQKYMDVDQSVLVDDSPVGLAKTSTNSDVVGRHIWEFRGGSEANGNDNQTLDWMQWDYNPVTDARPPLAPYSMDDGWETLVVQDYQPEILVNGQKVIGDSYIAGEGTGMYVPSTDLTGINECHRSPLAYPYLLSVPSGPFGPVKYESWACSGSVIADLYSTNPYEGNPPWSDPERLNPIATSAAVDGGGPVHTSAISRLSETDAVVQISISGNDMGFVKVVTDCVYSGATGSIIDSLDPTRFDPTGSIVSNACMIDNGDLVKNYKAIIDGDQIKGLIADAHQAAPHALIMVSGYPRFFPETPLDTGSANIACWAISPGVKLWTNDWISKLNNGIADQVKEASSEGIPVIFEDIEDVTKGHELCSSVATSDWYMNGINGLHAKESMHPNDRGHKAIADLIKSSFRADEQFHPVGSRTEMKMVVVIPARGKKVIELHPINSNMDAYMSGMSVSATTSGGTVLTPSYSPGGGTARISGDQLRMAVDPLSRIGDADVDMVLIAPDGTRYEVGDSVEGFTSIESPTTESMHLNGTDFTGWQLELTGVNMPEGGQQVYVNVSYDQIPNADPIAEIDATVDGRTVTVSAERSVDPDGEITDYFWDFGDGTTATGVTATHTYDFDAAKNVALQVTDSRDANAWAITDLLVASTLSLGDLTTLDGATPPATVEPGAVLELKATVGATFESAQLAYDALAQREVPCDGNGDPGVGKLLAGPDDFPFIDAGSPTAVGFTLNIPAEWDGTCHEVVLTLSDRSQASITLKVETPPEPDPEPVSYFKGFTSWTGWGDAPETALAGFRLVFGVDLDGKQGRDALKSQDIDTRAVSCSTGDAIGAWSAPTRPAVIYNRWSGDFAVMIDTSRSWTGTCREVLTTFGDGSSASFIVYFHSPSYRH